MTSTPAILWETFGFMGLASAVGWAMAVLLLAAGIGRRHRWTRWLLAAGLAVAGLLLAMATSASIRSIEVDRSAEVLAAEAAGAKAVQEKLRGRAANIRFAEDTAADQADVAGVTVAEEEGAYERAVEEQLAKIPAYRAKGKKTRSQAKPAAQSEESEKKENEKSTPSKPAAEGDSSAGTQAAGENEARPDGAASEAAAGDSDPAAAVRSLPESQLVVADRFDRGNRAVAWTVLAFAVGLVGVEYIRRFNSTFDPVWPVPLAGTAIDGLIGKQHVVTLPPGGSDALPAWLESLARKGESFLVFSAVDPLPGRSELPRVSVGRFRLTAPVRKFAAADLAGDPSLAELAFESAWFGRGSGIILGVDAAAEVLTMFATTLESRRRCRAAARCTLGIIWAVDAEPPAEASATIERLAAAMNVRWTR